MRNGYKEIKVSLHLPDNYEVAQTGETLYTITSGFTGSPSTDNHTQSNFVPESGSFFHSMQFSPENEHVVAGDEFWVTMQIEHDGATLLVDNKHTFVWNGDNQDVDIVFTPDAIVSHSN